MNESNFIPLRSYREYPLQEMKDRAQAFREDMQRRRTIRTFSNRPIPRKVIEECLRTAGTAPNGANMQPWHFVVVSDQDVKREIRAGAEQEEREFYSRRASEEWLQALAPLGTDWRKPFLEEAPYLIILFGLRNTILSDGKKIKNYYVTESVGIAAGILITAVHNAGLASLTHTPSPMAFLNKILMRPSNERPFLVLVVGYPLEGTTVPDIRKKPLEEIATFI
ncbi:MAG: nitroreductase family protein [Anaerolineae bacterium]|nr:nitroreductase family protein [Anaerolineae bacterium]